MPEPLSDAEFIERYKEFQAQNARGEDAARAMGYGSPRALQSRRARTEARLGVKLGRLNDYHVPKSGPFSSIPDGMRLTGLSVLERDNDPESTQPLRWVKTSVDQVRQQEMLQEAVKAMAESLPRAKAVKPPATTLDALLNCYVITDYHLGMLSWPEETGDDWNTDIAEQMLVDWFAAAIGQAPKSKRAVFCQLGDFMHWDGMDAVTPASKHLLDADGRFPKLVRAAIRSIRRVISMLLARHEEVHVLMAEGNHDPASSIWLREMMFALYEDEPRITVETSPDPYYCVEHGNTALFFHHGHKRKPANVDTVFAAKFREVFGRTKHAYAHMGHMHHVDVKETNLMLVEQHRTLAGADAYASRGGWMSGRDAQVITYHDIHGEVGRVRVSAAMVA